MKIIDLQNWNRKEHFEFFYRSDNPQYNVCANVDVTRFLGYTQKSGLSFYYAMLYAATEVANGIDNFRYRIRENKQIVLHEVVHPAFTDMKADDADQLFKMVMVEMEPGLHDFVSKAKRISEAQQFYFGDVSAKGRDDVLYITCIPWVSFTSLSHTFRLNADDAVPRISWGKYFVENGRTLLPFSVQAHHSFVDGVHIGKYFEKLQLLLDQWE
jgi:chloramphenicol O-acetyltransferase type A